MTAADAAQKLKRKWIGIDTRNALSPPITSRT
jgi:hypothetical protein